jgi:hypothetical protein
MKTARETKNWEIYRKADSSFHFTILEESGNRYLLNAYQPGAAALEALRARLQSGRNNFRQQSFDEHIEMAKLLRAGKIDDACKILRRHILIINDSLNTFPLNPERGARKGLSSSRDYAEVFMRSHRRDGQPANLAANRASTNRSATLALSPSKGRKLPRPNRDRA